MPKPVSREWLEHKYVTEGLDCPQIAKLVNRDAKSVWSWMKDFQIPTRPRGSNKSVHWPKGHRGRLGSTLSSAHREQLRQARLKDGRIPALINGVHWTKALGRHGSQWKGGVTPERQAFYSSPEWARCVKAVWKRADALCERCGLDHRIIDRGKPRFDIHHIDSFSIRERRAVVGNLMLVCRPCHLWIHSSKNTQGEHLGFGH